MAGQPSPIFPLKGVADTDLHALCQALWEWKERCSQCNQQYRCPDPRCDWSRLPRLEPYFRYYRRITGSYVPESTTSGNASSLQSHTGLLDVIEHIRRDPTIKRSELTIAYFGNDDADGFVPTNDQHQAFNLAVRIMLMIDCSADGQTGGVLEAPNIWHHDQSLADFIAATFPSRDHPTLNDPSAEDTNIKDALNAVALKEVAGLNFVATDDLRNHLRLDQATGTVEMYHNTTFLKESLRLLNAKPDTQDAQDTLALPKQLIIETLDSMQEILFPTEPDSQKLLRTLVAKEWFDPDCCRLVEDPQYGVGGIKYQYWGTRLMDLFDEIENPKPRGTFYRWLETRSKERHVMLAALIGIVTAVVLGLLALIVGIVQTYIAWQAWKHPVPDE